MSLPRVTWDSRGYSSLTKDRVGRGILYISGRLKSLVCPTSFFPTYVPRLFHVLYSTPVPRLITHSKPTSVPRLIPHSVPRLIPHSVPRLARCGIRRGTEWDPCANSEGKTSCRRLISPSPRLKSLFSEGYKKSQDMGHTAYG